MAPRSRSGTHASDYVILAGFRHALRALNNVLQRSAERSGLALQEQALLLALVARGGHHVPFAALREDLLIDGATSSELLRRMTRTGLITRGVGADRRTVLVSVTAAGSRHFRSSVSHIRAEFRDVQARNDLKPLREEIDAYFRIHMRRTRRGASVRR